METGSGNAHNPKSFKFKSYYVVWKPKEKDIFIYIFRLFKSYYVVWKPPLFFDMYLKWM